MVKSSLLVLFSICLWNICNCTDFFGSFGNNRNFQKPRKTDYYDTLGVDSSATAHDIKKAYRKSVITNHPDKGGDPEEFKVIAAAYEVSIMSSYFLSLTCVHSFCVKGTVRSSKEISV